MIDDGANGFSVMSAEIELRWLRLGKVFFFRYDPRQSSPSGQLYNRTPTQLLRERTESTDMREISRIVLNLIDPDIMKDEYCEICGACTARANAGECKSLASARESV